MPDKISTFAAAGDAVALARGNVPDRAVDRIKMAGAIKRVDGEDAEEYWAFREYIFSGPKRKLNLPAELLGKSVAWVRARSKLYEWEERALRYDEALANLAALAHSEETERMARRHARTGRVMQAIGTKLVRNIDTSPQNTHKLSEITALLKAGTEMEHKAVVGGDAHKDEIVVIIASFQEAANVKSLNASPDPQDAGESDDLTTIEMAELEGGSFAPVPIEGDEGDDIPKFEDSEAATAVPSRAANPSPDGDEL